MNGLPVPHISAALVDQLAKVAGLLGSDHDGERAAAGYRATALIREIGLIRRQVIEAAGPRTIEVEPDDLPSWRDQIQIIIQHPRESDFIFSIMGHGRKWQASPKQAAVPLRIYRKVVAS